MEESDSSSRPYIIGIWWLWCQWRKKKINIGVTVKDDDSSTCTRHSIHLALCIDIRINSSLPGGCVESMSHGHEIKCSCLYRCFYIFIASVYCIFLGFNFCSLFLQWRNSRLKSSICHLFCIKRLFHPTFSSFLLSIIWFAMFIHFSNVSVHKPWCDCDRSWGLCLYSRFWKINS